jgi:hypothetical protein
MTHNDSFSHCEKNVSQRCEVHALLRKEVWKRTCMETWVPGPLASTPSPSHLQVSLEKLQPCSATLAPSMATSVHRLKSAPWNATLQPFPQHTTVPSAHTRTRCSRDQIPQCMHYMHVLHACMHPCIAAGYAAHAGAESRSDSSALKKMLHRQGKNLELTSNKRLIQATVNGDGLSDQ